MIYVDDMWKYPAGAFRGMKMSHLITDQMEFTELHEIAAKIGVSRKWFQGDHYDICLSMRAKAVKLGATEITWIALGRISMKTGKDRQMYLISKGFNNGSSKTSQADRSN